MGDDMMTRTHTDAARDRQAQRGAIESELLARVQAGDPQASEELVAHEVPPLIDWTTGRLPRYVRTMADTQDIVQDVVIRVWPTLRSFRADGPGALQAYLRRAVRNQIVDEIRKAVRHRTDYEVPDSYPDASPSPFRLAAQAQGLARYRAALATLSRLDQALIVARVEHHESYEQVAAAVGKPNANAARVSVTRALARLVKALETRAPRRR
jgi:RNA polymerase sigma factor (sigma-70 family)